MKKIRWHILGPLVGVVVFALALLLLRHALRQYHLHEIIAELQKIPSRQIVAAVLLTALNFTALTGYDALALRFIRHSLSYGKIAFASFVAYAFSQGLGVPLLTGSSVRYRLYSSWGLSAAEVAAAVAFCTLTFWIGCLGLGGVVFIIEPIPLPPEIHLHMSLAGLGVIMVGLVVILFVVGSLFRKPIRIRSWELPVPSPRFYAAQLLVSAADWALAGTVLYALLPDSANVTYLHILGVFLLAQLAGLISQVPAGLGVFETMIIYMLSPEVPASQALGVLIVYRAVYYLLPLVTAAAALAARELRRRRKLPSRVSGLLGKWVPAIAPNVLALLTFLGGVVLLISGATPELSPRLHYVQAFLPLPVVEISHFLGSLTGACLLILARGIQRRLDAAYFLTAALLIGGIVFSLLKGFDYEEALILSAMLLMLLPSRSYFYRRASVFTASFSPSFIAAVIIVIASTIWLGMFSYKHIEYRNDLWWKFTLHGNAPRFMRASVGVIVLLLVFGIMRLLRPAAKRAELPGRETLDQAVAVIRSSPDTVANLALLGDKELLWNNDHDAFIMFGVEGRSWVAMGDPVGPVAKWDELAWKFLEQAERHGAWPVFYEVSGAHLDTYVELGLSLVKIGENARVNLETFSLQGVKRASLRHARNQVTKEGCVFEIVSAEKTEPLLSELKTVSDAWLTDRKTREKGFSLGFFDQQYLKHFPLGVVKNEQKILAFANIWLGADKAEVSVDLMRHLPDAPPGIMDYLFIELMLWGKEQGYKWFSLGMAPLSGFEPRRFSPLWNRVADLIYHHGENFYNFQGVKHYKDKFEPKWQSRFLASPGGIVLPTILTNLAALTSRGLKGVITK